MIESDVTADEVDSIYYIWSMLTKDILNNQDYNVDVLILDVSDINGLDISIPNITKEIKKKIHDKIIVNKYIIPSFNLEMFMEDLNIDYNFRHMLEDYMNKCSHYLDKLVNFYAPLTGNNLLFSDDDMLSNDIEQGIWLKSVRFVENELSNKILLTFSIFRKKGKL